MLSRHASSLFWLGRYQERTEFNARFLEVNYFATMDSAALNLHNSTMRSILFMSTGTAPSNTEYNEGDVIWEVSMNPNSDTSIITYVNQVRENAKSVRNLISNELWETINKNYHFVNSFPVEHLRTRGLHEFTHKIQENAGLFESKLTNTLLHNETWKYLKLETRVGTETWTAQDSESSQKY